MIFFPFNSNREGWTARTKFPANVLENNKQISRDAVVWNVIRWYSTTTRPPSFFRCFYFMYALFRSVTAAKNGKTLTPTQTGKFFRWQANSTGDFAYIKGKSVLQNVKICMGKKPIVSVAYAWKDFNKKQFTLMCVTSLLCGPRADLWPFYGFLSEKRFSLYIKVKKPIKRPWIGPWTTQERRNTHFK